MWITCGQVGRPGPQRDNLKLPNSLEEYQFSGVLFQGQLAHRARPGKLHGYGMAEISHLFPVDKRMVFRYPGSILNCRLEREGANGLNNTVNTLKIGYYPSDFVGYI